MAITNLTNTKWVIRNDLSVSILNAIGGTPVYEGAKSLWNIDFTTNGENHGSIGVSSSNGNNWDIFSYDDNIGAWFFSWQSQAYRIIEITGGTDVTNSSLIQWLEANATLVPVVDLSDTIWIFNSTLTDLANVDYDVNFSSDDLSYTDIHYFANLVRDTGIYYANADLGDSAFAYKEAGDVWQKENYKTIEFESNAGTDKSNPDLIVWLTNNATYQQPTPTKTFDLSTLQLSAGTHEIKVKARASGYRDSNFSNSVTYNVPQKYSGNIETYSSSGYADTKIKFDTPPQSEDDYDSATWSGFSDIYGLTSYQNKNKIYIWSGLNAKSGGKVKINNIETNGGTTYDTAVELDLTGNYTIYLFHGIIA